MRKTSLLSLALSLCIAVFVSSCGNITTSTVTASNSAITAPSNLKVVQVTSTSAILSWTPSSGDVFAYKIFRDGVEVGSTSRQGTAPAATVFADTTLTPSTSYEYHVAATSSLGVDTVKSLPVTATTLSLDAGEIPPPTALNVTQTTSSSVTITWTAAAGTAGTSLTYKVYRNNLYVGSVSVPVGSTASFTDTNLAPSTTYAYSVSVDTESVQSTQITATTQSLPSTAQNAVSTVAGTAGGKGSADAVGSLAGFNLSSGVASDGTSLYIADTGNNTIRKISLATREVTTLAGVAGQTGTADGIGSAARFNSPRGIACDGRNLYVADSSNNTIRRVVISTGEVATLAGAPGSRGSADGTGSAARFYTPRGVATDGVNLYVTDTSNNTIRKVVISTGKVTTLAGFAGSRGSSDGFGSAASFYVPYGITVNDGTLYVADTANNMIRRIIISSGEVSTLAGSPVVHGSGDGVGTSASFYYPDGMASDGTYVYVADTNNNTIRRISIATAEVNTIAGFPGSHGSTDGNGTVARFYAPRGLVWIGGALYLADSSNNTIRKISLNLL
ncbi:fibronectin type III domain-containing protein [Geomonas sp. RF6]|uniref:fibronectin type III domain-containing protein n=1 Tax=Geomonas sp. RF6 TaxID=2897342 RepID=UPI001E2CEF86|nr:fibronectin type III domain-containing protein [Geomonas sp. RF6]UFS71037.1 fibronectin type III domain-containing protein [Geomonas sp. RF6]